MIGADKPPTRCCLLLNQEMPMMIASDSAARMD